MISDNVCLTGPRVTTALVRRSAAFRGSFSAQYSSAGISSSPTPPFVHCSSHLITAPLPFTRYSLYNTHLRGVVRGPILAVRYLECLSGPPTVRA